MKRLFLALIVVVAPISAAAQTAPVEADYLARDFRFASGETLPSLKLHYRTLGTPRRDAGGVVRNAVLILHGTGGSGAGFLNQTFGGQLFGPGQILDAAKYFIVLPDGIGHGRSSKPSDGMHAKFPKYNYDDMVRSQHLLLTDGLKVDHLKLVLGTSIVLALSACRLAYAAADARAPIDAPEGWTSSLGRKESHA